MKRAPVRIGTAGWSVPKAEAPAFPTEGSHLERYAARLPAAEINTSFYRPHRRATYERWAAGVPEGFRFSVKMPKAVTHAARLRAAEGALDDFLEGVRGLGRKLGCILVQLPPSLALDTDVAEGFFDALRRRWSGGLACEPRHATWLTPEGETLLARHRVARVAADPGRPPGAGEPGGWEGLRYFRLHGSPRVYYSTYEPGHLVRLRDTLRAEQAAGRELWCILDNTALGAATRNALDLLDLVS